MSGKSIHKYGFILDDLYPNQKFHSPSSTFFINDDGDIQITRTEGNTLYNWFQFNISDMHPTIFFSFDICIHYGDLENLRIHTKFEEIPHTLKEGEFHFSFEGERKGDGDFLVIDFDRCKTLSFTIKNVRIGKPSILDKENGNHKKIEFIENPFLDGIFGNVKYITKSLVINRHKNEYFIYSEDAKNDFFRVRLNNTARKIIIEFDAISIESSQINLFVNDSLEEIPITIGTEWKKYCVSFDCEKYLNRETSFLNFRVFGKVNLWLNNIKTYQPKFGSTIDKTKVGIILQGVLRPDKVDILKTINEYSSFSNNIVISTYYSDDDKELLEKIKLIPNVKIVYNSVEENLKTLHSLNINSNQNNAYHQIVSMKSGMELISDDVEIVIKTRVDCYFSDLDDFICEIYDHPDKIVSSSLFVRGMTTHLHHPSDIIFGGKKSLMDILFRESFSHYEEMFREGCRNIGEKYVHLPYIKHFYPSYKNKSQSEYLDMMTGLYYIFCLNRHSSYNFRGATKFYDLDKSSLEYFRSGCTM